MKRNGLILGILLLCMTAFSQEKPLERLAFLTGEWKGTGAGFGNNQSSINASYLPVMEGKYLEVWNDSKFEATEQNPNGEHHLDKGMISYDKSRNCIVYRQFNSEGYFNQYLLVDSLSSPTFLVFETETIENFVPGGSARLTIEQKSANEIATKFYVSFPGRKAACFGTNQLFRKK